MKKLLLTACVAALAPLYAATDMGVIITDKNISDYAKVVNGSGGTATITIVDTNGTANAVTVYNKSQMDTALGNKAAASDVTALQGRATALESATNTLNTAVAGKLDKSGGIITGSLSVDNSNTGIRIYTDDENVTFYKGDGFHRSGSAYPDGYVILLPYASGTLALTSDILTQFPYTSITNAPWLLSSAISSWALAPNKPSYNFSELGNKPTTLSGYGITDAKITNGTITLGANSITPLTSYTETDPTALKPSQLTVNGTAMTTSSPAVELGQYYIATVDGKPHLFAR